MSNRRRTSRVCRVDAAFMPLLLLLGRLRCASYAHLRTLLCGSQPANALERAVKLLFADNLLCIVELPGGRRGYGLTGRAIRGVPALCNEFKSSTANVTEKTAVQGWQRAALWAYYTQQGALVLCGGKAHEAFKGYLLRVLASQDTLSSSVVGLLRESIDRQFLPAAASTTALDLAWFANTNECVILVADDPYRRMLAQLAALPVAVSAYDRAESRAAYLPPTPVAFVPSDVESRWDAEKCVWTCKGPRLRQWLRYTTEKKGHEGFPYHRVLLNVSPPALAMLYRRALPSRSFSQPFRILNSTSAPMAPGEA